MIKTSQELINLLHKLVVKPLLGIPTKQDFTLFHKLETWWVSLMIIQIIIHIQYKNLNKNIHNKIHVLDTSRVIW